MRDSGPISVFYKWTSSFSHLLKRLFSPTQILDTFFKNQVAIAMDLHQIKKLHNKGNNYHNQKKPHRMGESLCHYSSDKGLISRIYKELQKLTEKQTIQSING
jgi:hypothetical protein